MYKGSPGIASLYLSLLDSSEEADSPPSHYQLLSEVKATGTYDENKSCILWVQGNKLVCVMLGQ